MRRSNAYEDGRVSARRRGSVSQHCKHGGEHRSKKNLLIKVKKGRRKNTTLGLTERSERRRGKKRFIGYSKKPKIDNKGG